MGDAKEPNVFVFHVRVAWQDSGIHLRETCQFIFWARI
ncbi:hypothetical protein SFMTTN_2704 [Sulfuriferula multivorans]|uniref:Uncharacterized protein n=1 Tax=Sulfuriferula multivorans TaxID=1559896 RepID=A0A401JGZ1_9PROT|nr:hypothetical protein SFMTTN_2704 [Sulfuriferula multivorans]